MTIPEAFQAALQHHQSGRLAEAEAIYRQILAADPRHADALHLLGVLAHQVGRNEVAEKLIHQAITLNPFDPVFHYNLGEMYRKLGRLDEAITAYRRAIQLQPDFAEAHNNLGNALRGQGHLDEAVAAYRLALQFQPEYAEAHNNLGNALKGQGHLDEAMAAYRRALQFQPEYAEAHNNLGNALRDLGHLDEAMAACRRAIQLQPECAEAHNNLGNALRDLGHLDEAVAAYHRALQIKPEYAEAHNNLGNALRELGHLDAAMAECRRAVQLKPECAEAHNNLGNAFKDQGHLDEAMAAYHRAIQIKPEYAEAHNNLGNALRDLGHLDEAMAAYHRAIQIKPEYAEAHNNLGNALRDLGHLDETMAAYHRAIQIKPDFAGAKWNSSHLLLLRGDFASGWPLFEERWDLEEAKQWRRGFSQPMWKGEALAGQRVLLHAEMGFGDTLQFVRYAPLVAQRGGSVIVECQPGLKTLLRSVAGVSQIIERGEPLPDFDLHCPLMSLPLAFGTRIETIPSVIPYLHADEQKAARWRERLEQEKGFAGEEDPSPRRLLKIGLVWAGGVRVHQPKLRPVDERRSMRLSQFAPWAGMPGVVFVSLQKGGPAAQAKTPPEGMRLLDWTDEIVDFTDTAALVECLDLVISVDTAVAHLAGALGKPVWLLNRFNTCWRWMVERADSPWYPTMRLFRQPRFMEWEPVIAAVREQLELSAGLHQE